MIHSCASLKSGFCPFSRAAFATSFSLSVAKAAAHFDRFVNCFLEFVNKKRDRNYFQFQFSFRHSYLNDIAPPGGCFASGLKTGAFFPASDRLSPDLIQSTIPQLHLCAFWPTREILTMDLRG